MESAGNRMAPRHTPVLLSQHHRETLSQSHFPYYSLEIGQWKAAHPKHRRGVGSTTLRESRREMDRTTNCPETDAKLVPAAVGMGGNVGDTAALFRHAVALLTAAGLCQIRTSRLYRTEPVDCVPGTPAFLNAALVGTWAGTAAALLAVCQDTERRLGRPPHHCRHRSRTVDLDLLLFGDEQVREPGLVLPHPRFHTRLFVLVPLCDVASDWIVPPGMVSVREMRQAAAAPAGHVESVIPVGDWAAAAASRPG